MRKKVKEKLISKEGVRRFAEERYKLQKDYNLIISN